MRNAWFPGLPGGINFESMFSYAPSSSEQPQKTLVTVEGHASDPWAYTSFDRERQHEHVGRGSCSMCIEREQLYRKGAQLDLEDLDLINEKYATEWEDMERIFESVGLGKGESDDMDQDQDGYDEDVDIDDAEGIDETDDDDYDDEEGELDFIEDPNAEVRKSNTPPVRRGTDRAKIEKCDGIRDIIFSGSVR